MKNTNAVIGVVAGALCLSACAGLQTNIGTQRIVERLPENMPSWVEKSGWDKSDRLYFTGAITNAQDQALGLREARAEGEKKVVERIKEKIRTEFGKAIEGQNQENGLGVYVKDVITKVSENVEISGISESEQYIEKVEERVSPGVRYLYNCHVLLTLSREDYADARLRVFEGAVKEAKKERNQKAEHSLQKAFEKLLEDPPVPESISGKGSQLFEDIGTKAAKTALKYFTSSAKQAKEAALEVPDALDMIDKTASLSKGIGAQAAKTAFNNLTSPAKGVNVTASPTPTVAKATNDAALPTQDITNPVTQEPISQPTASATKIEPTTTETPDSLNVGNGESVPSENIGTQASQAIADPTASTGNAAKTAKLVTVNSSKGTDKTATVERVAGE